jgi:hypothetical protein
MLHQLRKLCVATLVWKEEGEFIFLSQRWSINLIRFVAVVCVIPTPRFIFIVISLLCGYNWLVNNLMNNDVAPVAIATRDGRWPPSLWCVLLDRNLFLGMNVQMYMGNLRKYNVEGRHNLML